MSEEQTTIEGIETPEEPQENVRKSKAFQAVTTQLNEERAKQKEIVAELDKLRAAEEERQLHQAEKAGEFETVKATLQGKIDALQAEMETTRQQAEITTIKSDVKAALAARGIQSAKALEFIAGDYLAQDERGDIGEWVETISSASDYAIFFGANTQAASQSSTGSAPKPSTAGSVSSGNVNWTETKSHLHGQGTPQQAKAAMDAVQKYIATHGKAPF